MADKRTEKSSYPSKYSPGGWVSAAQYIIELVCENKGKFDGKGSGDLPLRFWKLEKWQKFFASQTRATHKLLKKYDASVIISTIRSKNVRTLFPKWIEQVIQEEQKKFDAKKAIKIFESKNSPKQKERIIEVGKTRTKSFSTSSIDKLLALEEEFEEYGEEG